MLGIPFVSDVKFGWNINFLSDVFAVLLALTYTFRQQVFNLSVDGTEVIFCPCGNCVVQFRRKSKRYLLFVVCHINTDFHCLQWAVRPCFRTVLQADCLPLPPFFLHQVLPFHRCSVFQAPFLPCPLRRQQSFFLRQ